MKKNSFRFKRNRKAITALLICVGFVGIHPLAVFAEDDVNVVQTVQQQKQTITGIVKDATGGTCDWSQRERKRRSIQWCDNRY